jgi:hypothetical protein
MGENYISICKIIDDEQIPMGIQVRPHEVQDVHGSRASKSSEIHRA